MDRAKGSKVCKSERATNEVTTWTTVWALDDASSLLSHFAVAVHPSRVVSSAVDCSVVISIARENRFVFKHTPCLLSPFVLLADIISLCLLALFYFAQVVNLSTHCTVLPLSSPSIDHWSTNQLATTSPRPPTHSVGVTLTAAAPLRPSFHCFTHTNISLHLCIFELFPYSTDRPKNQCLTKKNCQDRE